MGEVGFNAAVQLHGEIHHQVSEAPGAHVSAACLPMHKDACMKINMNPSSVLPIRSLPKADSSVDTVAANAQESVTISKEGLKLSDQSAAPSAQEARDKYERVYGSNSFKGAVWAKISKSDEHAKLFPQPLEHIAPEQMERIAKSISALVAAREGRSNNDNPFVGLSRAELVAIVEDESGGYSDVERYAAIYAKNKLDYDYFQVSINIIDTTGDPRAHYKGYMDFLDSLGPVERLGYPADDREVSMQLLKAAEQKFGKLPGEFSLWDLIEHQLRRLEKDSTALVESPPGQSK